MRVTSTLPTKGLRSAAAATTMRRVTKPVLSPAEAVADIPDGATVMISGFGGAGAPVETPASLAETGPALARLAAAEVEVLAISVPRCSTPSRHWHPEVPGVQMLPLSSLQTVSRCLPLSQKALVWLRGTLVDVTR